MSDRRITIGELMAFVAILMTGIALIRAAYKLDDQWNLGDPLGDPPPWVIFAFIGISAVGHASIIGAIALFGGGVATLISGRQAFRTGAKTAVLLFFVAALITAMLLPGVQ